MAVVGKERKFGLIDDFDHRLCETNVGVEEVSINIFYIYEQMLASGQVLIFVAIISNGIAFFLTSALAFICTTRILFLNVVIG